MRHIGFSELHSKSDDARIAIRHAYHAERDGMECAGRAVAHSLVSELRPLQYRVTHPKLSYGEGYSWGGKITVEQDAEISRATAIKVCTLYRIGVRLTSPETFNRFVSDAVRWAEEDARNAA